MKIIKLGALPEHLEHGEESRSEFVCRLIRTALQEKYERKPVPDALLKRFTVSMPDSLELLLKTESQRHNVTPAILAAELIASVITHSKGNTFTDVIAAKEEASQAIKTHIRPILHNLLDDSIKAIEDGKIILAEASTGTGKGRMIAAMAIKSKSTGPVVISAPLPIMRQLVNELRVVDPTSSPQIILGRGNFIDPVALEEWLADNENPALAEWLAAHGPTVTEETKALNSAIDGSLRWLADDLVSLGGDEIPLEMLRLNDGADAENPAELIYRALRDRDFGKGDIIVCTHMALATDCRFADLGSRGFLPEKIGTLLVDEAHLLEAAFAAANCQTIHLHALGRRIDSAGLPTGKTRTAKAALDMVEQKIWRQKDIYRTGKSGLMRDFHELEYYVSDLRNSLAELPAVTSRTSLDAREARKALRFAKAMFDNALSNKATVQIGLSPVQERPLFTVGRANLEKPLNALWERCSAAVLVSATLYVTDTDGSFQGNYSRWVLNIPKNRVVFRQPVIAKWITSTPEFHILDTAAEPASTDNWYDIISSQARTIYNRATGGTLVLLTSHAAAAAMSERLADLQECVITQGEQRSAAQCASLFRELHAAGKKPIWLGVGTAWTGIDLSDHQVAAADDTLLTDLFIPRIPFRCNKTLTHDRRAKSIPIAETYETIRMLRQGLGRLVRREGLLNRHIWFGDKRIQKKNAIYTTVRRVFNPYIAKPKPTGARFKESDSLIAEMA